MPIPDPFRSNFSTMLRAAENRDLALVECADIATGEPRYVICAVGCEEGNHVLTPFGHLCEGDPFEIYQPPAAPAGE